MRSTGLTRRDLLRAGAAGAAAFGLTGLAPLAALGGQKKRIPVALQLYSVRDDAGKDLPGVLEKVAKMGYEGVEFAGYYGHKPEAIRKLLDADGLVCCSTHTGFGALQGDALKGTVELHKTLGAKFITVPGGVGGDTKQAWLDAAKKFNDVAAKLKADGIRVGYHNHSAEFKVVDGEMLWDTFCSNTVKDVVMQLDTGNAMGGGGDPVAILKKYPGRAGTIHLKEHGGDGNFGAGDCPWKEIFELCETIGGTEWYIVEQETYKYPPLKCVEQCMEFMKKMGKAKA
ncbi:MAG TPA: TIM barrel protein [Phycisphaerae bacterium]|nr:TIM barrel protein [Phycisphaerae bacterium]